MLLDGPKALDKLPRNCGKADVGPLEALATVDDILVFPVLRRVLCNPTNFSFNPNSKILARIDRAELGDFDALVLGLLLMAHFKGQLVIPDFGFYGCELHQADIREGRLIAGVNFLGELPVKLRQAALLIDDKVPSGTTMEDAETIAQYAELVPGTIGFTDFTQGAMRWRDHEPGLNGHGLRDCLQSSHVNELSIASTMSSRRDVFRFKVIGALQIGHFGQGLYMPHLAPFGGRSLASARRGRGVEELGNCRTTCTGTKGLVMWTLFGTPCAALPRAKG
jgi:hypothetical protein